MAIEMEYIPTLFEVLRLTEVQYLHDGIGHFPSFPREVLHGFSWGKMENMAYAWEQDAHAVTARINAFFEKLDMHLNHRALTSEAYSENDILDADEESIALLENRGDRGIFTSAHAIFTQLPHHQIVIKPGDCFVTLCCGISENGQHTIGMIHSGRKEINRRFPSYALSHFLEKYHLQPSSVRLGIVPGLGRDNHTVGVDYYSTLDASVWEPHTLPCEDTEDKVRLDGLGCLIDMYTRLIHPSAITAYDIDTHEAASRGEAFSHRYASSTGTPNGRNIVAIQLAQAA